ncbi:hypothetical protein F4810DRAFT_126467 [Camillea tinctor]|nr:hypothetical protein F4810DRAFT_126467 [Camillea tinctor]
MCHINYYICSRCYHGYARFTNVCPEMHPPLLYCPMGTPFHIRIVEESACALHPFHSVYVHNPMMFDDNQSTSQTHDKRSQGTPGDEGQRATGTEKPSNNNEQNRPYPDKRNESDPRHHRWGIYAPNSQNSSFYPYHNTPMYPFYYGYSGNPGVQPPFHTPPLPPASQLSSPESYHAQGSSRQTPLNPNAQVFHSQRSQSTPSELRSGHSMKHIEIRGEDNFYNDKRGISRSSCNEADCEPETNSDPVSTYTDRGTQCDGFTPRAIHTLSSPGSQPQSDIQPQQKDEISTNNTLCVAVPITPRQKAYGLSDSPFKNHDTPSQGLEETKSEPVTTVTGDAAPPDPLVEDTGLESEDRPQIPESSKESSGLTKLEQQIESVTGRQSWSDQVEEALSSESCFTEPSSPSLAHEPFLENHHSILPPIIEEKQKQSDEAQIPSPARKPKKIFDESDFPALGSTSKAGSDNKGNEDQSLPEGDRRMSSATIITDNSGTTSVSSPQSPLTSQSTQPSSQPRTPRVAVSWSSILTGKHKTSASISSPAPKPDTAQQATSKKEPPHSSQDPSTPTPARKKTEEHVTSAGEQQHAAEEKGPAACTPTPATATPARVAEESTPGSATPTTTTSRSTPKNDSTSTSTPTPSTPQPQTPAPKPQQPQPRLWSQLVGGGPRTPAPVVANRASPAGQRKSTPGKHKSTKKGKSEDKGGSDRAKKAGEKEKEDDAWPSLGAAGEAAKR